MVFVVLLSFEFSSTLYLHKFRMACSNLIHFQGYLKLAYQYGDAKDVPLVIERVRAAERELIESPDVEFRFHSGVPA